MPTEAKTAINKNVCGDCGLELTHDMYEETKNQGVGFVSPESEEKAISGELGTKVVAQQKTVCKECFLAAFKRKYPDAPEHPFAAK